MYLVNTALDNIGVGTAGLVALLGYMVVFIGLIFLMLVVMIVGKIMVSAKKAAPAPSPAPAPVPEKQLPEAPGTAGECKLYNVSDREAAMLMAIVANKMGKPLNTLRFKSMKEVQ